MRCGICTWVFGERDLDRIAADVGRLGFDGIELLADPGRYEASAVRRIVSRHGLSVLSLTPADADPAHPDPTIRARAIDDYRRMLDLAADVEAPILGFHGAVGRVRPLATQQEEERLLLDSAQRIGTHAEALGVRLAVEVLNRYESHLLNRSEQAARFVDEIGSPAVGILLDTYHMNIEEADPAAGVDAVGARLLLLHVADSNRRGIGRGHVRFEQIFRRLAGVAYEGAVVVESTAPIPDPFAPAADDAEARQALDEAEVALAWLRKVEKAWHA